jgi:hypothetical protein
MEILLIMKSFCNNNLVKEYYSMPSRLFLKLFQQSFLDRISYVSLLLFLELCNDLLVTTTKLLTIFFFFFCFKGVCARVGGEQTHLALRRHPATLKTQP